MPLLKKPGLDTAELNNYHPVSNLFFMSELIVMNICLLTICCHVFSQHTGRPFDSLVWFILRPCQHDDGYIDGWKQIKVHTDERTLVHSARSFLVVTYPSTNRGQRCLTLVNVPLRTCPGGHRKPQETAQLRVWSDMLMAADERKVKLFSLLNMSAAFDFVDHHILLQRLQVAVDIGDLALDWIRSFLRGRTQQAVFGGGHLVRRRCCSAFHMARYSDRCCTSPIRGAYYRSTLPFDIIAQHRVNAHQYADDLQLYLCVPPAEASIATDRLDARLVDVEAWLKASRLKLQWYYQDLV